jgi:hypothetical protein
VRNFYESAVTKDALGNGRRSPPANKEVLILKNTRLDGYSRGNPVHADNQPDLNPESVMKLKRKKMNTSI